VNETTPDAGARQRKPRRKPPTVFDLSVAPDGPTPGILRIQVGRTVKHYYVSPAPSDFGTAYRLEHFAADGGDVYSVLVAPAGAHQCDCLGHQRHGHCKHVTALSALTQRGALPGRRS
jgi:hypothetical protein